MMIEDKSPKGRMMPTQQQQIDALKLAVQALQDRIDAAERVREDTHTRVLDMQTKVDAMYRALMEPQIGQGNASLIERMASVTVEIESGKRTADNMLNMAKWLVGIAAAVGVLFTALRFGINPRE